jgi:hypothetical protein
MANDNAIYVGPWVGEFGHWIMHVVPFINGIRYQNPDAKLVVSAFAGDDIYLMCADEYVPIKWWPCNRGNADVHGTIPADVQEVYNHFKQQKNHIDIFNLPFPKYQKLVKDAPIRLYHKFGRNMPTKDHIVVMPRGKNYTSEFYRSWLPSYWRELIIKLAEHMVVYVGGIAAETIVEFNHPNIVELHNFEDRPQRTIDILSSALCCVADCCGGSQIAVQTCCPTIVHGPDNIQFLYDDWKKDKPSKNFFGTYVKYIAWKDCRDVSVDKRLSDVMAFIQEVKQLDKRSLRNDLFIL